jgi:hypothetical protein
MYKEKTQTQRSKRLNTKDKKRRKTNLSEKKYLMARTATIMRENILPK